MKLGTRLFTLFALVSVLVLAPVLPAAAQDSNPLCAGLLAEDCQVLVASQDALGSLQSFTAPEWLIDVTFSDGTDTFDFMASGSGAVVLPRDGAELLIHLMIDHASVVTPDESQSGSAEVIITDEMIFVRYNDQWYGQELDDEDMDLSDLRELEGLDASTFGAFSGVDLSGVISTVRGTDETLMDQNMAVFATSFDINQLLVAVLMSPLVGQAMGIEGLDETGMTAEDIQMLGMFLGPMLTGTTLTFTQWVGADDSMVRQVGLDLVLNINPAMLDPEASPITGQISFRTQMDNVNEDYSVELPQDFEPLEDLEGRLEGLELGM